MSADIVPDAPNPSGTADAVKTNQPQSKVGHSSHDKRGAWAAVIGSSSAVAKAAETWKGKIIQKKQLH